MAYPGAIKNCFKTNVLHRTNKYLNNLIEQDHRDIKDRYYAMRGFKDFISACIFCSVFDEVRNLFRKTRTTNNKKINSTEKRSIFSSKFQELKQHHANCLLNYANNKSLIFVSPHFWENLVSSPFQKATNNHCDE